MTSNIRLYKEHIPKTWKLSLESTLIIAWVGLCSWSMFTPKKTHVLTCSGNTKDALNLAKSFGKSTGFPFDQIVVYVFLFSVLCSLIGAMLCKLVLVQLDMPNFEFCLLGSIRVKLHCCVAFCCHRVLFRSFQKRK